MSSYIQRVICTALLAACSLLVACSGVETRPEATDTFAAANYRYYSWLTEPLANTANSQDAVYAIDPLVRRAIDRELRSKGYQLNPEKAQFSVDYRYAQGTRVGEVGGDASNLSTYPGVVPNRNMDGASVDNAYALAGVKITNNIGIQMNDIANNKEVWRVVITKIVENVNSFDATKADKNITRAVKEGMRTLPSAN
ncbi:MAG: DUF4136 domain-containing protein [Halioglobus sp.]